MKTFRICWTVVTAAALSGCPQPLIQVGSPEAPCLAPKPEVVYQTRTEVVERCPLAPLAAIPKDVYLRRQNGVLTHSNSSGIQFLKQYLTIQEQLDAILKKQEAEEKARYPPR
jgi:hypothetical protein